VGVDPAVGRRAAHANPYHLETMRWAGAKVVAYLKDLDLIGGPGLALWRRSLLM